MVPMTREFDIRLVGHDAADGTLLAGDAVAIIDAFKDVTYRLTRAVAERPGLGRAAAELERLASVRVALRPGSTRVVFTVGDDAALDIDPLAAKVDETFWDIVDGMAHDRRPPAISDSVAAAVDDLIVALGKAARTVEVSVPGVGSQTLEAGAVSRVPWQRRTSLPGEATMHGVLEMVDARTGHFRVRDDAHNAIELLDVPEPEAAATLVTQRVTVVGPFIGGEGTRRPRMEGPRVSRARDIGELLGTTAPPVSLRVAIAASEVMPAAEPLDLTDDELDDFLAAIRA